MNLRANVVLLLTAVTAACAATPTNLPSPSTAAPTSGGTVVVAWQEPSTLDLLRVAGVQSSATIARVAVEGLMKIDPSGNEIPVLARELPTLANGQVTVATDAKTMSVRYGLREGVLWSDGAPFTSADVRFTWRTIMSDPKVASREGYDRIADIDTPDDLSVLVHYRAIDPAYLSRFDVILPQHLLEGASEAARAAYGRAPLGTGPFRITEFIAGDHVTAQRNERYRAAGRPYLDRVIFRFTPSLEVAKAQLRVGEADLAPSLFETDVPDLAPDRTIAVTQAPSPVVEAVIFNLARPTDGGAGPATLHPILSDLAMRRALLLATPKQRIVDGLLFGRARVGTSEIPIGWAAVGDLTQDSYDAARAKGELDAAGWAIGADGVRAKNGARASLRLTGTTGNAIRERIEQVLVDEWRGIGVEVRIANVPSATLTASWSSGGVRKRGAFDMVIANAGLGTAGSDPLSYLTQRRTCASIPTAANGGSGANYERLCDPRLDRLLDQAATALARDQQRAPIAEVLRALNDRVAGIWIYDRGRIDAANVRLHGIASNGWDQVTWNVEQWWVGR